MTYDVAIIGLGYVGLPLARQATESGLKVLGFDISEKIVNELGAGISHIDDISDSEVVAMLRAGFIPTTDENRLSDASTIVGSSRLRV